MSPPVRTLFRTSVCCCLFGSHVTGTTVGECLAIACVLFFCEPDVTAITGLFYILRMERHKGAHGVFAPSRFRMADTTGDIPSVFRDFMVTAKTVDSFMARMVEDNIQPFGFAGLEGNGFLYGFCHGSDIVCLCIPCNEQGTNQQKQTREFH